MLQTLNGVVLHTLKYNDLWLLAEVYTEQTGRATFRLPLSRSRKRAARSMLFQPLSLVEMVVEIRPRSSIHTLKEVRAVHPFASIPYNSSKSAIALFLAEFLYRAVREEGENRPLFAYLYHSIVWLDASQANYANFHLVFLMRLSRFLGFYPNLENYVEGACFDLLNGTFSTAVEQQHAHFLMPEEASRMRTLMRMNYETMHLFTLSRAQRMRCLVVLNDYYRLHLPDFPVLRSMEVLKVLFD
ncbi:MAG: DNA repair protein RecO [Prevotellaceae bacterium]|jgi:DNA repair protein RecO (recombination protein O)|nr:DNA repair protein RecO [Prevotellaceae bacterium]